MVAKQQGQVWRRISAIEERLRILESRIEDLTSRFESFRMNVINSQKAQSSKIKLLIKGTAELSRKVDELRKIVERVERKLVKAATKAEIKELEAYLALLDPLRKILEGGEKGGNI